MFKKIISSAIITLLMIAMPLSVFAAEAQEEAAPASAEAMEAAAEVPAEDTAAEADDQQEEALLEEPETPVEEPAEAQEEPQAEPEPAEEPAVPEDVIAEAEEAEAEIASELPEGETPSWYFEDDTIVPEEEDYDGPAPVIKPSYQKAARLLAGDPSADLSGLKIPAEELDDLRYFLLCEGLLPEDWFFAESNDGFIMFIGSGPFDGAVWEDAEEPVQPEAASTAEASSKVVPPVSITAETMAEEAAVIETVAEKMTVSVPVLAEQGENPQRGLLISLLLGLIAGAKALMGMI